MSDKRGAGQSRSQIKRSGKGCVWAVVLCVVLILPCLFGPLTPDGIKPAADSNSMVKCRQIDLAMFSYANDHNLAYPDGNSSTEVFQKLLDGNYVSDPAFFYLPYTGKIKPGAGQKKLKAQNVCFDVTCCVEVNDSDSLPLVFLTGFRVSYTPGGTAVPLLRPLPQIGYESQNWGWLNLLLGKSRFHYKELEGIAVTYKSNSSSFRKFDPAGIIPKFISSDFVPNGKTYRQLTPDGVLP